MSGKKLILLKENPSEYVKLNVGGTLYSTTVSTLTKYESMLKTMFKGEIEVLVDTEGFVLIDRCGKHFGRILNFFRDGKITLPKSEEELQELLAEVKYYCITELITLCENSMKVDVSSNNLSNFGSIVVVTNNEDNIKKLIETSPKPVIIYFLNMNRVCQNKRSLENICKQTELFHKLTLCYSELIVFIKTSLDAFTNSWWFYNQSKLIGMVDPTQNPNPNSIDVCFPECKIYEQVMNLLGSVLFKNIGNPSMLPPTAPSQTVTTRPQASEISLSQPPSTPTTQVTQVVVVNPDAV